MKYCTNKIPKLNKNRNTITTKIRNANLAIIVFDDKKPLDASTPVSACCEKLFILEDTDCDRLSTYSLILLPIF